MIVSEEEYHRTLELHNELFGKFEDLADLINGYISEMQIDVTTKPFHVADWDWKYILNDYKLLRGET